MWSFNIKDAFRIRENNPELSSAYWLNNIFKLKIPIYGYVYLAGKLKSDDTTEEEKAFFRGYLLYKLIMLIICMILFIIGVIIAVHYIELALEYMKLL